MHDLRYNYEHDLAVLIQKLNQNYLQNVRCSFVNVLTLQVPQIVH